MSRRSAPQVRVVLTVWAALALWLVPAAFRAAELHAPASVAHAVATPDAAIDAARLPVRVETTVRGTLPSLARGGGGTPAPRAAGDRGGARERREPERAPAYGASHDRPAATRVPGRGPRASRIALLTPRP